MKKRSPRIPRMKSLAVCLIAAVVAVAFAANITTASASNDASAAKSAFSKAQLKLVKKYAKSYAKSYAKTYAKAGPAGANGANGANGAGPAYVATQSGSVNILSASFPGTEQTVITKTVPAGTYVINASADLLYTSGDANVGASGRCHLYQGATEVDDSQSVGRGIGIFLFATVFQSRVQTHAALNLGASTTITLKCQDNTDSGTGDAFTASNGTITAIQVTSIN